MSNEIVPVFRDTVFNDDIKDLASDALEIGIDSVMENEILAEVPIVKSVIALGRTGYLIHERNLMKQTLNFVKGFNSGSIDENKLKQYRDKIYSDSAFAEKELGRIIIILNKQVEDYQSLVLGKIYSSYVNGNISWQKFCEYSEANERMFLTDYSLLHKLSKELQRHLDSEDKYKIGRLIGLGFVVEKESPASEQSVIDQVYNNFRSSRGRDNHMISNIIPSSDYEITEFGEGFLEFLNA